LTAKEDRKKNPIFISNIFLGALLQFCVFLGLTIVRNYFYSSFNMNYIGMFNKILVIASDNQVFQK
jgi:hypothetical protein